MKKVLVAVLLMASVYTYGQSSAKSDLAMIQSFFGKEKKALVTDFMHLNEPESKAFWPVYEAYEKARQGLVSDRLGSVGKYVEKAGDLNESSAYDIMNSMLKNDKKLVKLESKYLGKMKKAVGATQATKFFQLENYLRNVVSSKIQENIPAIDQLIE